MYKSSTHKGESPRPRHVETMVALAFLWQCSAGGWVVVMGEPLAGISAGAVWTQHFHAQDPKTMKPNVVGPFPLSTLRAVQSQV